MFGQMNVEPFIQPETCKGESLCIRKREGSFEIQERNDVGGRESRSWLGSGPRPPLPLF